MSILFNVKLSKEKNIGVRSSFLTKGFFTVAKRGGAQKGAVIKKIN